MSLEQSAELAFAFPDSQEENSSTHHGGGYRRPAQAVLDALHAPVSPLVLFSPTREYVVLLDYIRYPTIADLAQRSIRLAGLYINPRNNGPARSSRLTRLRLRRLESKHEICLLLPHNARISYPQWSPDGRKFLFTNTTEESVELWICEAQTPHARRLDGLHLNAAFETPASWLDSSTLILQLIPRHRGVAPIVPVTGGPFIQESRHKRAEIGVHKNLIRNPGDEDLFDHYATSQLALFDLCKNEVRPLGQAGVFPVIEPSPTGKLFLVTQLSRPYSRNRPQSEFPRAIEIWNRLGALVQTVATRPAGDDVPRDGVSTGPREVCWHPLKPSTLIWVEALDDGDPAKEIAHRVRVMMLGAPFKNKPRELVRTRHRFSNLRWTSSGSHVLISDYDRDRHWRTTLLLETGKSALAKRMLWSYDSRDRANRPGSPVSIVQPNGRNAVYQTGDSIFIAGEGGSTSGPRPFLDCLDLRSLRTQRLFQSAADCYEEVVALVARESVRFITRRESATDPPNYLIRDIPSKYSLAFGRSATSLRQAQPVPAPPLTRFFDHARWQHLITKQLVTY
jgi:dipeptidyl aminopeptidase/acylaminoacyl peptidase